MIIKKNNQKLREVRKQKPEQHENTAPAVSFAPTNEYQNITQAPMAESTETDFVEEYEPEIIQNVEPIPPEPEEDLFNIEEIDFAQRKERRRGSRRRGYRRIDDRNLVSRAQEEADNIKKSAFEEGYRKGLEQCKSDLDAFRTNLIAFMNSREDVFEYIAPDILEISVDIAKKIIKKEVESDPQVLINTIVDVLKTLSKNEPKINIKVKPQAVQFIKDTIPNITYQYGIDAKINIIADPSIEEGGCVFQTNNGIVDASIDTQLEIIKKALEVM